MSAQSISSRSPGNTQDCESADIPVTFHTNPSNVHIPGWPSQLHNQDLTWSNAVPPISSFLPSGRQYSSSLTDIHSVVPSPAGMPHSDVVPGYSYSSYMAAEANPGQAQMPSPATSESFSPWLPGSHGGGYQITQSISDSAIEVLHPRHMLQKYSYHQGSGIQSAPDVSNNVNKDCYFTGPRTRNSTLQTHSQLPDVVPGNAAPLMREQPKTLKEAVCMYIDHLIKDNERMVSLSQCHVTASPANFEKEAYYHEAVAKVMDFPSSRFRYWLQNYNIDIQIVPAEDSDQTNLQDYSKQKVGNKDIVNNKAKDLTLVAQCQANEQPMRMEDNHFPIFTSNLTPSKPLTFQTPIDDFTDDDSELDTSVSVTDTPDINFTLTPRVTPIHRKNGSQVHTPRSVKQSLFNTPRQMPKTPEDIFGKLSHSPLTPTKPHILGDICNSSPLSGKAIDVEGSPNSCVDTSFDKSEVKIVDNPKNIKNPDSVIATELIPNDFMVKPTLPEAVCEGADECSSPQSITCSESPTRKRTKPSPDSPKLSTRQKQHLHKISPSLSSSPASAEEGTTSPKKRWKSVSAPKLDTGGPCLRSSAKGKGQLSARKKKARTRKSKSAEIVHETEDPLAAC